MMLLQQQQQQVQQQQLVACGGVAGGMPTFMAAPQCFTTPTFFAPFQVGGAGGPMGAPMGSFAPMALAPSAAAAHRAMGANAGMQALAPRYAAPAAGGAAPPIKTPASLVSPLVVPHKTAAEAAATAAMAANIFGAAPPPRPLPASTALKPTSSSSDGSASETAAAAEEEDDEEEDEEEDENDADEEEDEEDEEEMEEEGAARKRRLVKDVEVEGLGCAVGQAQLVSPAVRPAAPPSSLADAKARVPGAPMPPTHEAVSLLASAGTAAAAAPAAPAARGSKVVSATALSAAALSSLPRATTLQASTVAKRQDPDPAADPAASSSSEASAAPYSRVNWDRPPGDTAVTITAPTDAEPSTAASPAAAAAAAAAAAPATAAVGGDDEAVAMDDEEDEPIPQPALGGVSSTTSGGDAPSTEEPGASGDGSNGPTDLLDEISQLLNPRPASNRGKIPVTAVPVPIKKRAPVSLRARNHSRIRRTARELEEDGNYEGVAADTTAKPSRRKGSGVTTAAAPGEAPVIEWQGIMVFQPGGPASRKR